MAAAGARQAHRVRRDGPLKYRLLGIALLGLVTGALLLWGTSGPGPERATASEALQREAGQRDAAQRLAALGPRYRDHLRGLMLDPGHAVDSSRLPRLIGEQQALARELEAIAALSDPRVTERALKDGAELDRMFAAWLEMVSEATDDEEAARQLLSLSERHYAASEAGLDRLRALSPTR